METKIFFPLRLWTARNVLLHNEMNRNERVAAANDTRYVEMGKDNALRYAYKIQYMNVFGR